MEWTIVTVIIALLGLVATIFAFADKIKKPIETLNCSIIQLTTKFDALTDRYGRDEIENKEAHKEFCGKIENHETRIVRLEEHN